MKKKPKNGFYRKDICPYCGYKVSAATMINGSEKDSPVSGDLTFCLMCNQPAMFSVDMKLKKFDLNSINDIVERNRLKLIQIKMDSFWDSQPEKDRMRRDKYLDKYLESIRN